MWRLSSTGSGSQHVTERELADAWRAAKPFPHLIFDDFVEESALPELLAILDEEPVETYQGDIFAFDASRPEPKTEGLATIRETFSTLAAPLARITGKPLRRADMRAYAYRPGHFLLPHTDHQQGVGRAIAYAYYVPSPEPPEGGELELFACTRSETSEEGSATGNESHGELLTTESALLIEPRGNRLVVFDVSDVSLHQVREVLGGLRVSLAGWFYP